MIALSDKSRWAVVALIEVARRGDGAPVPVLEVAERRGIAPHLVEQIFSVMRRAGLLQSQRGVKGGYSLRRPPADITVLEVVEAVDGPIAPSDLGASAACDRVWSEAGSALSEVLAGVTLAEVMERDARAQAAPMFHI
jgi:Rrf2 family protein